jgi:hypothetical protein
MTLFLDKSKMEDGKALIDYNPIDEGMDMTVVVR